MQPENHPSYDDRDISAKRENDIRECRLTSQRLNGDSCLPRQECEESPFEATPDEKPDSLVTTLKTTPREIGRVFFGQSDWHLREAFHVPSQIVRPISKKVYTK